MLCYCLSLFQLIYLFMLFNKLRDDDDDPLPKTENSSDLAHYFLGPGPFIFILLFLL